jgi:hypothetical protein
VPDNLPALILPPEPGRVRATRRTTTSTHDVAEVSYRLSVYGAAPRPARVTAGGALAALVVVVAICLCVLAGAGTMTLLDLLDAARS